MTAMMLARLARAICTELSKPEVRPECEKATTTSPARSSEADIAIICVSSSTARADADPQELVGDVARDLRRAAEAVEIALMGAVEQFRRMAEGVHVEDRQRLLQRLDRGAEDLLDDRPGGVVGRDLLVKIDIAAGSCRR